MSENRPERPAGEGSRLEALLRAQRAQGFEPGFAWRVMHRLRADPREALIVAVQRWFARLAPLAALATLALALLNARAAAGGQSLLEAALGLPAVTAEQAYSTFEPPAPAAPAPEGKG
ncbi:MAG TPA: hypothetical protein VFJ82_03920 [Longimicrobium sp.]|nr:hypothetical protein [Longimicrobium sp.]